MDLSGISQEELDRFCEKWRIRELAVFGSASRGGMTEDSDIDLLVDFHEEADWSLLDHIEMEEELAALIGREVDLVTRRSVERSRNWVRRNEILSTSEPVYAAG